VLSRYFELGIPLGLAQAVAAIVLALAFALLARGWRIHLEGETVVALFRGLLQIVMVGSILLLLLRGPGWSAALLLLVMMFAAALLSARRARGIPGAFVVSFYGIGIGGGLVIVLMTGLGVMDPAITSLVPVGSMIIANAMNSNALALERFSAEVTAHAGDIEAGLSLGALPEVTVRPYLQAAVTASLIPRIDSLRSLGIVWIPGLMAGMVLSGTDPVYAAIYQFVVIVMVYAAAGLTTLVSTLLVRRRAFSSAMQLLLRRAPGS